MLEQADVPLKYVVGEIIPAKFEPFKPIDELISKIAAQDKLLKSNDKGCSRPIAAPTIRNNHTLFLNE